MYCIHIGLLAVQIRKHRRYGMSDATCETMLKKHSDTNSQTFYMYKLYKKFEFIGYQRYKIMANAIQECKFNTGDLNAEKIIY